MSAPEIEQRKARRFALHLPVLVKYPLNGSNVEAETQDVSTRGICFCFDTTLEVGSELEFTLTLPAEVTMTQATRMRCKGKVVRVESTSACKAAIAVQIEQYEFLTAA